jgi:hypothetical protein
MKTTKKRSKLVVVGMLGILLALGMVFAGCLSDSDAYDLGYAIGSSL